MSYSVGQRLGAEMLGTAFLLATVVGSGIMAERLADGNVALALLCNALPTGAILVVMITMLGPVSGAHFNPAVTAAFLIRGELGGCEAAAYLGAQILGGLLGVVVAHLMFDEAIIQFATTARTGPSLWFAEIVATFGLVGTILITIRTRPDAVAMVVGLYITAAYWFTASTSFANPAVTIARGFSDTFAGIRPQDIPAFVGAEILGAIAAVLVASALIGAPLRFRRAPSAAE